MKKFFVCTIALFLFSSTLFATTFAVNCDKPGPAGKIRTYLKFVDPRGPNTLKISGTCHENIVIQGFDRLSLIAESGAVLKDASQGQKPVLNIVDSRRIAIQNFTIIGGSSGVLCFDGSLCRFSGNTFEGTVNAGVWVNHSQAAFSGDVFQDTGGPGLSVEMSTANAETVTILRSGGPGIYDADGGALGAWALTIQDGKADGILVVSQSHMELGESTISGNAYNGIDVGDQSEVLLIQNTVTGNGYGGVGIGEMSLAELGNGGTFIANGQDISCDGTYSIAANIQAATYGTTNCPVPAATEATTGPRKIPRPPSMHSPR